MTIDGIREDLISFLQLAAPQPLAEETHRARTAPFRIS